MTAHYRFIPKLTLAGIVAAVLCAAAPSPVSAQTATRNGEVAGRGQAAAKSDDKAVGADANSSWSEAVDGVQCRLRPARRVFWMGEPISFLLDVRNTASAARMVWLERGSYEVEFDGVAYTWRKGERKPDPGKLNAGEEQSGIVVDIAGPGHHDGGIWQSESSGWWQVRQPGEHKVRVRLMVNAGAEASQWLDSPVLLIKVNPEQELQDFDRMLQDATKVAEVRAALERSPELVTSARGGVPAVCRAALTGAEMLQVVIDHGAPVDGKTSDGRSALMSAVANGKTDAARLLLERGADVNAVDDRQSQTALHDAAMHGNVEIVELLIEHGAKVDAKTKGGITPLVYAAVASSADEGSMQKIADMLIAGGAKLDITTAAGLGRAEDVAKFIAENPKSVNEAVGMLKPLHVAAYRGRLEVATLLLDAGADVNDTSGMGDAHTTTPLMCAATGGHLEVMRLLVQRGAKVDAAGEGGRTALHVAAASKEPAIVEFLLKQKAEIDVRDGQQRTPLMAAASAGNIPMVRLLLDRGADVNAVDSSGKTVLQNLTSYMSLRREGAVEAITLLLEKGADPNAADKEGRSAWLSMFTGGSFSSNKEQFVEVCKLFLDHGANINAKDSNGRTALMQVIQFSAPTDIVSFLVSKGADPTIGAAGGGMERSPIAFAMIFKPELAEILCRAPALQGPRAMAGDAARQFLQALQFGDAAATAHLWTPSPYNDAPDWFMGMANQIIETYKQDWARLGMAGEAVTDGDFATVVAAPPLDAPVGKDNRPLAVCLLRMPNGTWLVCMAQQLSVAKAEEAPRQAFQIAQSRRAWRDRLFADAGLFDTIPKTGGYSVHYGSPLATCRIVATASGGTLRVDVKSADRNSAFAERLDILSDEVRRWDRQGFCRATNISYKFTNLSLTAGKDGIVAEGSDHKAVLTADGDQVVCKLDEKEIRELSITLVLPEVEIPGVKPAGAATNESATSGEEAEQDEAE